MNEILKKIGELGMIPVIKLDDAGDALPLAKALIDGGLPAAEITYRTSCARDAIAAISDKYPEMTLGAGTILTREQAEEAVVAGAKFIVSPGLNPEVVGYCTENDIPVLPGCATPTDVETAIRLGLDTVKFFPAEASGGLAMIKALSGPYKQIKFMPTGGISPDNMIEYLKNPNVLAVGGSFMVKDEDIREKRFDKIASDTRAAVLKLFGFELLHVGINNQDEKTAQTNAAMMTNMFGFAPIENAGAVFTGGFFEFMKYPYLGKYGHIAIGTNFIVRAVKYFEAQGYTFNQKELKYNADGTFRAAYFNEEFFGFAIHLLQK